MSTMEVFCSSPTKVSSVVLPILALILYAISPERSWFLVACIAAHVVPMFILAIIFEIYFIRPFQEGPWIRASMEEMDRCEEILHSVSSSLEEWDNRRRLQELRLQVSLPDREIYSLENFAYQELPSGNISPSVNVLPSANIFGIPTMNDKEINALPVHDYRGAGPEGENAPPDQPSSSSASAKEPRTSTSDDDDGLTCTICFEQVMNGHLIRILPCFHQFHCKCINRWIAVKPSCPNCKAWVGPGRMGVVHGGIRYNGRV